MKRLGWSLAVAVLGLGMAGVAGAATMAFEGTVNFFGSGSYDGRDYFALSDGNNASFAQTFTHVVSFDPVAESILSAELVLSHRRSSGNSGEVWVLWQDGGAALGELSASNGSAWVDQVFFLDTDFFSAVGGSNWSLSLRLTETTSGTDKVWLDQSILRGTYLHPGGVFGPPPNVGGTGDLVPVPEPGSLLLLGTGLLALGGFVRCRGRPT